jgi:hypothetical protein
MQHCETLFYIFLLIKFLVVIFRNLKKLTPLADIFTSVVAVEFWTLLDHSSCHLIGRVEFSKYREVFTEKQPVYKASIILE